MCVMSWECVTLQEIYSLVEIREAHIWKKECQKNAMNEKQWLCHARIGPYNNPPTLTTFEEVSSTRPDSCYRENLAWDLIGFPFGPLPVLHTFLVPRYRQHHSPTANASGLPLCQ